MKQMLILLTAIAIITSSLTAQTIWTVDNAHSGVKFSVSHLVISEVEGNFKVYSGTLLSEKEDFAKAAVEFTVDVASINTDNEMRDKHLRTDDFFNTEKYPKMTFKSISWKKVGNQNYIVEGDLTIRDVTKRTTFEVVHGGMVKDSWGNTKAGFKAKAVINRFDFGLTWNSMVEAGGATVGKDVTITLNLQFAQKKSS